MDDKKPVRSGFGLCEKEQMAALSDMESLISAIRFSDDEDRTTKKPFQQGILVGISSLRMLFQDLKSEGVTYLLTTRVNQDCLESFFSRVRGIGGDNTHPNSVEFMHRVRTLTLSCKCHALCENNWNTESDNDVFLSSELTQHLRRETQTLTTSATITSTTTITTETAATATATATSEPEFDFHQSSKDCLQYIGGYIARKVDKELYSRQESETDSNSWIAARSNGNLVYPTDDLMDILLKCDEQFIVFHGNTLNTEKEWHESNILISMST